MDGIIPAAMLPDLKLHDIVRLRKTHPCGSYEWKVLRIGADIRLECLGCQRLVMLSRRKLAQRVKSITSSDENHELPNKTAS